MRIRGDIDEMVPTWSRAYQYIAVGALLTLVGAGAAIYCSITYRSAALRDIGPGMFPACVGIALAVFGVAILLPAFFRCGQPAHIEPAAGVVGARGGRGLRGDGEGLRAGAGDRPMVTVSRWPSGRSG